MVGTLMRTPASWFSELDRFQRELDRRYGAFGLPVSIRAASGASFPAINIGSTPTAVEVYAFAPGLDASKLEVTVDNNLLTLTGERKLETPDAKSTVYAQERFAGAFRRAISLPEDVDPTKVEAHYKDGVVHVSIARRASVQPRRITVN
ncbi:MAG: Hsp20/alpha crystallin family protein [Betaproteobacteria bacterium]|nr:Hsp20/alpha crystallin family protein [Betaproteobacteria bacterium]